MSDTNKKEWKKPELKVIEKGDAPTMELALMASLKPTDLVILNLKESYGDPSIFKNKTQLNKAVTAVAKERKQVEKIRKDGVSKMMKMKKGFNDEAERLKGLILEIETPLIETRNAIVQKEKEAKKLEEEKVMERFTARTQRLFDVGFTYDGANYVVGTLLVTPEQVDKMEDGVFDATVDSGKAVADQMKKLMELAKAQMEKDKAAKPAPSGPEQPIGNSDSDSIIGNPDAPSVDVVAETPIKFDSDGISEVEYETQPPLPEIKTDGGVVDLPFEIDTDTPADTSEPIPDNVDELTKEIDWDEDERRIFGDKKEAGDYRPAGYIMGFNACRKGVLDHLKNNPKLRRAELISFIENFNI